MASRSFGTEVSSLAALREAVAWHVDSAATRLRAQGSVAGAVEQTGRALNGVNALWLGDWRF